MPAEIPTKFTLLDLINDVKQHLKEAHVVRYVVVRDGILECRLPAFPSSFNSLYIVNPANDSTCLEICLEYGSCLRVNVRPVGASALYTLRESESTFEGMSDVVELALRIRPLEFRRALGLQVTP